eukprot:3437190-Lingulodinium_polyedra.AAC.1
MSPTIVKQAPRLAIGSVVAALRACSFDVGGKRVGRGHIAAQSSDVFSKPMWAFCATVGMRGGKRSGRRQSI